MNFLENLIVENLDIYIFFVIILNLILTPIIEFQILILGSKS